MTDAAPFFGDLAEGPPGGRAVWLRTSDGVRLRLGLWPEGSRGLVLLFPGRTEYVEKYGRIAADLARRGYGLAVVDWRGQGLSDRPLPEPLMGHVERFGDFQIDVAAVMEALAGRARYLLSHSMGGAIALRALAQGLPMRAAVFSAPMWGIRFAPFVRPMAWTLSRAARLTRQGRRFAPGTGLETYVKAASFADNMLTRNEESFLWMRRQIAAHPELALAGPTLHWLGEAMAECRTLRTMPSPPVPTLTALGGRERVVDPAAVAERMARWPGGRLEVMPGVEHEVMMEVDAARARFVDLAASLFDAHPD